MKSAYRSTLGITLEILEVMSERGSDGIIVSHIATKVKVSHNPVLAILEILVKNGLVEKKECLEKKRYHGFIYILNETGLSVMKKISETRALAKQYLDMKVLS